MGVALLVTLGACDGDLTAEPEPAGGEPPGAAWDLQVGAGCGVGGERQGLPSDAASSAAALEAVDQAWASKPACAREGLGVSLAQLAPTAPGQMHWEAASVTLHGFDRLDLHLRHGGYWGPPEPDDVGFGSDGSVVLPIVAPPGDIEATCEDCVTAVSGCTPDGQCDTRWVATSGRLHVERWDDGQFRGSLDKLLLYPVQTDREGALRIDPDAEPWCVSRLAFDEAPPSPEHRPRKASPVCVPSGTGTAIGRNVADAELSNCLGESVRLHEWCGTAEAIWLYATTGWCEPCSDELRALAAQYGGRLSRDAVAEARPGLDMWVVLGEDEHGGGATQESCLAYAEAHDLDPAMVLVDHQAQPTKVSVAEMPGFAVAARAFGGLYEVVYPYFDVDAHGTVGRSFPWSVVLRGRNLEYYWSDSAGAPGAADALRRLLRD